MPQEGGAGQMRWKVPGGTEYETVRQYLDVVQKNQAFAVAAGVVVHQHTRVLMADLHRCGDSLSEADVREGVQQLTAELAAAYEAAAVGLAELQRVVVEKQSGPQGKAAVDRRVAEANARCKVAWTSRALCTEVLTRIREQSRLAERAALVEQQAAAVVESQTAGMGCSGRGAAGDLQQSTTNAQAGHGDSQLLQETFEDTLLEPTAAETSEDTLLEPTAAAAEYVKPDMEFFECSEWPPEVRLAD